MADVGETELMVRPSVLEKLQAVQPLAELWWDSSPLVYDNWRRRMIAKAADPAEMTVWLDRLFCDANPPGKNIFRGVTTNPRLTLNAIRDNPAYWSGWIDERHPCRPPRGCRDHFLGDLQGNRPPRRQGLSAAV